MSSLEDALRRRMAAGGKVLVPYVTGGLPGVEAGVLHDLAAAGADAIEVGIPFSDPIMDGPVIQEASRRALEAGATLDAVLEMLEHAESPVPVVIMTYLNPVLAMGEEEFLSRADAAEVSGVIIPDLPVDEAHPWIETCLKWEMATVFLAAPGTSPERLEAVARASAGFVYCVSTYGVTGRRDALSGTSREVVDALRPLTGLPLVVGVGISTPDQGAAAGEFADGVVVGSALMARLLEGDRAGALDLVRAFRAALH